MTAVSATLRGSSRWYGRVVELALALGDVEVPASLDVPDGAVRGGLVVLHGAAAPQRSFFLYAHLASVLPRHGIAVMRYDRRESAAGNDIPFDTQAADAVAALRRLRAETGAVVAGVWGISQGGWAAPFTAARYPDEVGFVVAVSAAGVSPERQMRYATAQQLRRHGFGDREVAELLRVRAAVGEFQRGTGDRDLAQRMVDAVADAPWFPYAYLRRQLPAEPGWWDDMDFDPEPIFAAVTCPVLAVYGETDAWVPVEESIACWQRAARASGAAVEVARVPGCDHLPSYGDRWDVDAISADYTAAVTGWLDARVAGPRA